MDKYGEEQVSFFIYRQASMAMIGRIGDTSKLLSQNLKENQKHSSYSIICKLCRSKYAKMMSEMCRIRYCSGSEHILLRSDSTRHNFAIIIQMRRDRRNGGHPALRIMQS